LRGVLTSTGAKSYNKGGNTVSYQRVDRVASRIVEAAKQLCDDNVTEETERLKNKENLVRSLSSRLLDFETKIFKASSIERAELSKLAMQLKIDLAAAHGEVAEATELVARWKSASQKLKGSWNYILTDAKSVNAFVTDLFPRRIFVHIGLIEKVDPTDDELGLILGHEISHLILGHVEETTNITTILLISQLVILSFIDPIGYLSMFADSMVATVGSYITNSFSRNTEEDADALGIAIAAMACFDTKKGANVFLKLGILEGNMAGITQWNSSHPSTQGRYHRMLEYSDKYQRSPDCVTYLEAMKKLSTILAIPPWMNRS
jgi:Zn-dependent protease with chaperone function